MGTIKKDYQRGVFYQLTAGKVRRTVHKDIPKAEMREVTNPKTGETKIRYEVVDDAVEGFITSVVVNTEGKYSDTLEIAMVDKKSSFTVVCNWGTGYAKRIIQRLPNVDFTKEVYIEPYDFLTDDDVQRVGANVFQEGNKIESLYHKVNSEGRTIGLLNNYPPYDESLIGNDKDELALYNSTISKFLKAVIAERIVPALHEANLKRVPPGAQTETAQYPVQQTDPVDPVKSTDKIIEDSDNPDDDLPF